MSNMPDLPNFQASRSDWLIALNYRLEYAEWAVEENNVVEKINAQNYLNAYIEGSPPQCRDFDQIALNEIYAIHLQNFDEQLSALKTNRLIYEKIAA